MIKNAVIYFSGRLPMVADLRALPAPSDMTVLATNLRTRDGKRPSFADSSESWFILPLREVMAIELPRDAIAAAEEPAPGRQSSTGLSRTRAGSGSSQPAEASSPKKVIPPADASPLEPDEDLLARIRQL
ncbi:MAG TPA: hypothetical protein VM305_07175 [Candidatus Limnocylindrales bacterium]|nr:hypothetical protein [Candidatus Limnocylindrales bacterium]